MNVIIYVWVFFWPEIADTTFIVTFLATGRADRHFLGLPFWHSFYDKAVNNEYGAGQKSWQK